MYRWNTTEFPNLIAEKHLENRLKIRIFFKWKNSILVPNYELLGKHSEVWLWNFYNIPNFAKICPIYVERKYFGNVPNILSVHDETVM